MSEFVDIGRAKTYEQEGGYAGLRIRVWIAGVRSTEQSAFMSVFLRKDSENMRVVLCGDLLFSSRNLAKRLSPEVVKILKEADAVFCNAEFLKLPEERRSIGRW